MTLCAWCEDTIEAPHAGHPAAAHASHGMCKPCLDGQLAALAAPRPRALRPFAGAPALGVAPALAPAAA